MKAAISSAWAMPLLGAMAASALSASPGGAPSTDSDAGAGASLAAVSAPLIVRADPAFPSPIPLGLLPADAGPPKALWPRDLMSIADLQAPLPAPYDEAKQAFDAALYPQVLAVLDGEAKIRPLSPELRYLRGLALLRAGISDEAGRELLAVADLLPALRARCLFSAAVALEDQRAFALAAELYARSLSAGPESAVRRDALIGEARMLLSAGTAPGAARAVELLTPLAETAAPPSGLGRDVGAETLLTLAQLAERHGQAKKAALRYREIWAKHPLSPLADEAESRAGALGAPAPSAGEQVARAELVLNANHNPQAIALLTPLSATLKLSSKPPKGRPLGADPQAVACEAHFLLAKALKKQRRHTEAGVEFAKVLEACQDPELKGRALYLAGQSAAVIDPPKGRRLFAQLAEEFPQSSFADDALFFEADLEAKNLADPAAATAALRKLVAEYPTGDYAGEARFRLFWIARQGGAPKEGLADLETLAAGARNAPRQTEPTLRARYWLAQTLSDHDRLAALAADWPGHYYADLAAASLVPAGDGRLVPAAPPLAPLPTALHAGTLVSDPNFEAGLALLRLGFLGAADEELLRVDRLGVTGPTGRAEPLLLLSLALHRAGDPRAAHAIAKTLIESDDDFDQRPDPRLDANPTGAGTVREGLLRLLFDIAYPRAFRAPIEKWSLAAGVPPDLLQGLMREESALDPQALSGAGAVGLCQLMPSTGKLVARRIGLGAVSAEQLRDPELNIRLGAAYLGELLQRYQGRAPLAVAAYNAGEGAVDRWLSAAGPEPLAAFVEDIPIAETRHYVKRVLTSAAVYRTLPADLPLVATQ